MSKLKPAFAKNNQAIVFATDANYVPYMTVSIQSIINHADAKLNYDILIFDDGITAYQKELLSGMCQSNVSIRFIDVKPLLAQIDGSLFKARGIWSAATYYRLFIPQVLADFGNVLYLDGDVLVKDSLKELFALDLKNNMAACVYDELHYTAVKNRIADIAKYVGIKDWRKYFNAGIILFNIKAIDAKKFVDDFLEIMKRPYLPFLDQDILNILFEDKFLPLDWRWNYQYYTLIDHPELQENNELVTAEQNRHIIHYITQYKPWNSPQLPHAAEWWQVARQTPFYEQIVFQNTRLSSVLLRNLLHYPQLQLRYGFCKLAKMVTCGKLKSKIAEKVVNLKRQVKQVRSFYKGR